MEVEKTNRGFTLIQFKDHNSVKCSIQKSSAASDDLIWLGCNEPEPRVLVPGEGWKPLALPEGTVSNTRMHLSQETAAQLAAVLQYFAVTGELPDSLPSDDFPGQAKLQ